MEIKKQLTSQCSIEQFNFNQFQFGVEATDHMLVAKYSEGAWHSAAIQPYENLTLSPLAMCLHYGQTVFEGLKAYRQVDDGVSIFRLDRHHERINQSLRRMAMPEVPKELFENGIKGLVEVEQGWIKEGEGNSLYIRPFVIATEERLGVSISTDYLFVVVCTPMAAYYARPLKVKVERYYTRATSGGVGAAKNGGNYGAAYYPAKLAQQEGFDQVIWTDSRDHEYVEESGTMNLMFIIGDKLLTPPAGETILAGVTRDSLLQIARDMGWPVEERPISLVELQEAFEAGKKVEAFGAGTAAVVAPFALIHLDGNDYKPYIADDAKMFQLKAQLTAVRSGKVKDPYAWNTVLEKVLTK
ncbi:branched-chain amino acid aminotransferase [Echinicola rosea]|uniref:branched-chain-amino-acid transaminase n=1 Tax=Echinicola rosea TaxID=1807691 RepID=A0ABQ1UR26_9BACT|nr:branched-chain amino acid aminotransferase [Echinicola rosea]GGF23105.1 branched-chain-amino-acid aminotransferase [Echinicola rosea]